MRKQNAVCMIILKMLADFSAVSFAILHWYFMVSIVVDANIVTVLWMYAILFRCEPMRWGEVLRFLCSRSNDQAILVEQLCACVASLCGCYCAQYHHCCVNDHLKHSWLCVNVLLHEVATFKYTTVLNSLFLDRQTYAYKYHPQNTKKIKKVILLHTKSSCSNTPYCTINTKFLNSVWRRWHMQNFERQLMPKYTIYLTR